MVGKGRHILRELSDVSMKNMQAGGDACGFDFFKNLF